MASPHTISVDTHERENQSCIASGYYCLRHQRAIQKCWDARAAGQTFPAAHAHVDVKLNGDSAKMNGGSVAANGPARDAIDVTGLATSPNPEDFRHSVTCGCGNVVPLYRDDKLQAICTRCGNAHDQRDNTRAGQKDDAGKLRYGLVPTKALRQIVEVLEFGARRYGEGNWMKVASGKRRYTEALLRHVYAWMDGERVDPDSGKSHLAHAGCCIVFLLVLEDM